MLNEDLASMLSGLEALSGMLERFITAYETEPRIAEMLFAMVRAKEATEQAATAIRKRLLH